LLFSRVLKNCFNATFDLLAEPKAGGAGRHRLATSDRPEVREVEMSGVGFEVLPLLMPGHGRPGEIMRILRA
jgi:hypothetical protein